MGFVLAVLLTALTGCGSTPTKSDPSQECRDAARLVMLQVMSEPAEMSVEEGNAYLDDHCAGVSATDRKAIVDGERSAAIARWASS